MHVSFMCFVFVILFQTYDTLYQYLPLLLPESRECGLKYCGCSDTISEALSVSLLLAI